MTKSLFLTIITMLFFNMVSFSQEVDESKNFIYTDNNELIYAKNIKYKTPFLTTPYLLVDSIKYKSSDVKFYKNNKGFFANVSFAQGLNLSGFAEREIEGKINLYLKEVTTYTPGFPSGPNGMMMGGGFGFNSSSIQYYNKGFEDLKRAKYKYLIKDLADNENSIYFLNKYKRNRNIATGFFVAGGTIGIIGLVGFIKNTSDLNGEAPQNERKSGAIAIAGVGTMFVGSIISFSLPINIEKAIEAYNE